MNKKVAFIDHSYHKKTKSSNFFIDFLIKRYQVDIYYDTYWNDKIVFNFKSLNEKDYDIIVFWQCNYSIKYIKKLKCKNIIYIPMYDDFIINTITPFYWKQFSSIKFISFSKALHRYLAQKGLVSFHIQYFPEFKDIKNELSYNNLTAYFWYRVEAINWETIKQLISPHMFKKIYIKNYPDPGHNKLNISKYDIKQYGIKFVEWFENKEEYIELLKSVDVYFASRPYEGIGLSFLEAISYGKFIVALDSPTMNEYIIHKENGYLYNFKDIKKLDIQKVDTSKIQEINIRHYSEYKNSLNDLVRFIESSVEKNIDIEDMFYCLLDNISKFPIRVLNKIYRKIR